MTRPITLVYVMGSARSGSTLLTHLLSNHRSVTNIGGIVSLNDPTRVRVCRCGEPLSECPFWRRVSEILADRGQRPLDAMVTGLRLRSPSAPVAVPALPELLLAVGTPALVRLAGRRSTRVRRLLDAASDTWCVASAAAAAAGAGVVVNNSKRPTAGLALYHARPKDHAFRLIHLLRDGRGSVSSIRRRRPELSTRGAVRLWRRRSVASLAVFARVPERARLRVRYEDLCAEPERTLGAICRFVGIDYESGMDALDITGEHGLGGSDSELLGAGALRLDDRWRTEMSSKDLRSFSWQAGPLNRLLGYR